MARLCFLELLKDQKGVFEYQREQDACSYLGGTSKEGLRQHAGFSHMTVFPTTFVMIELMTAVVVSTAIQIALKHLHIHTYIILYSM